MRFYERTEQDIMFSINRCFIDADHGRVALALERLRDLASQFPPNPHICYAEGLISRDYLGQGMAARGLFHTAYELALGHPDKQETRWFAACNAAGLASNEQEFRHWAEIAFRETPAGHEAEGYPHAEWVKGLDQGAAYSAILFLAGSLHGEAGRHGPGAATLELALLSGELTPEEELEGHKGRAHRLRQLDERAHQQREPMGEAFPADERLTLHEAIKELDAAIALDDHNAELWNFKSAWCYQLGRYEETIQYADRASLLRPHNYPRPYINKASALWELDRADEARAFADEALKQAQEYGVITALRQAEGMVEEFSRPRSRPTLKDLQPRIKALIAAARLISQEDMGQHQGHIPLENIVNRLINHASTARGNLLREYVPVVADLLADFTPETAFCASLTVADRRDAVVEYCLTAALYIAAHSDGVQRRDAARYLALMTLFMMKGSAIRTYYRQGILEPSAAATDEMSQLDAILREELGRINPQFPALIADQEPVDEAGREQARRNILSKFVGGRPNPAAPSGPGRSAVMPAIAPTVEFRPVTCGICNGSWKRSNEQVTQDAPHQLHMMLSRGITQGHICEKCNMFICELCFLKAGGQCFLCRNKHCSKIWVEDLDEVDREISSAFSKHIWAHVVTGVVSMLGIGFCSPYINQSISIGKSIGISILAVALMSTLISPMRGLSPLDKSNALLLGRLYGGIWGAGVGTIAGWGGMLTGGMFDFGLAPWIVGLTAWASICTGFSLSTPARVGLKQSQNKAES